MASVRTSEEATAASVTSVTSLTPAEKTVLVSQRGLFSCPRHRSCCVTEISVWSIHTSLKSSWQNVVIILCRGSKDGRHTIGFFTYLLFCFVSFEARWFSWWFHHSGLWSSDHFTKNLVFPVSDASFPYVFEKLATYQSWRESPCLYVKRSHTIAQLVESRYQDNV